MDLERMREAFREMGRDELLDRDALFRPGLAAEALPILEEELARRGIGEERAAWEAKRRAEVLFGPDGLPLACWKCQRAAVGRGWRWQRLWGYLPLFPRPVAWCADHV